MIYELIIAQHFCGINGFFRHLTMFHRNASMILHEFFIGFLLVF